jgi:hypothetical protein
MSYMKLMWLVTFLFPAFLSAQDCKVLKEQDPYTKEIKMTSGFISLQGASLSVEADKSEIDFFFIVADKCFNDATSLQIFFEGSRSKATFRNAGSMNCDGYFHFKFKNGAVTPTAVKNLSTKKVTQFVFNMKDDDKKPITITLRPDQQDALMKAAACVSEEAKSLIK